MTNAKKPTSHKVLVLTATYRNGYADIEDQLDRIAAEGWTIHVTRVDVTLSQITLYGWATK